MVSAVSKSKQRPRNSRKMLPPVNYLGCKQRIAKQILYHLPLRAIDTTEHSFCDVCCGTGAISMALVSSGILEPQQIKLLDIGMWGVFWNLVGKGEFELPRLKELCDNFPLEIAKQDAYLKHLSTVSPVDEDAVYCFLLMQCGTCMNVAWEVSRKTARVAWTRHPYRAEYADRYSNTNPFPTMMPSIPSMYNRVSVICDAMYGVEGIQADFRDITALPDGLTYFDPPYECDQTISTQEILTFVQRQNIPLCVSYDRPISETHALVDTLHCGIKSVKSRCKKMRQEFLNYFHWKPESVL